MAGIPITKICANNSTKLELNNKLSMEVIQINPNAAIGSAIKLIMKNLDALSLKGKLE